MRYVQHFYIHLYNDCIMTMISNFTIYFMAISLQHIVLQTFLYKYSRFLHFYTILGGRLLITLFFLLFSNYFPCIQLVQPVFSSVHIMLISIWCCIVIWCSCRHWKICCGICWPIFVADDFSWLFVHSSALLSKIQDQHK